MNKAEAEKLCVEWLMLAAYYRENVSDVAVKMYSDDVSDLPFTLVLLALKNMRREPTRRRVPLPAEVRERCAESATPGLAAAVDMAALIWGSISRFGYTQPKLAETALGPVAWMVVERLGGWQSLCATLTTKDMGVFQAQARELCKAELERAERKKLFGSAEVPKQLFAVGA